MTIKPKRPRDAAGGMTLKEGTGGIIAMCPCGDFLEIYKADKTFRVLSPKGVDPDETNPNAPWVSSPVDDVGSSNPIVARIMLQSNQIIKGVRFSREVDEKRLIMQLHSCKEALIACEKMAVKVCSKIKMLMDEVESQGVETDNSGRGFNPFPHTPELDHDCGSFLVYVNRVIKLACELPMFFADLDRADSNFDHLASRLADAFGEDAPVSKFVSENAGYIRHLIELRNYHEHPTETKRTTIDNFRLMPDGKSIRVPMWHVSGNEPKAIKEEMESIIPHLLEMVESMLVLLVMETFGGSIPYIVVAIPEDKIDPNCPIRYQLSVDTSKLVFKDK
jgi:hypothetical protein